MEPNKYYSEWKKQFKAINEAHLEYVTIGALAMVLHGLPRATVDLDIAIPVKKEEILKIRNIASKLGYSYDEALVKIAMNTHHAIGQCLTLSDKDNIFHLDIFLSSIDEFNMLRQDSQALNFDDAPVVVASLNAIKTLKKRFNRETDRADIELIDKKLKSTG